ncbi:MAG: glycosyltransferase [Candidatus Moranbacteria bacterium]|nr:glycosyltransferase [Candidatus Moranbacteria bacterium]
MKLFLIKIGKAWNVLRRDGAWRGGRRVYGAFLALFRRVRPGDILFITNGVGDSARYRTTHIAEELEQNGFTTALTVQDNPFLLSYVDKFSVFVFHRVLFTEKVKQFIELIKTQKKEIIFEADDLVYDPQFLQYMAGYDDMNTFERKLYENGLGGEIINDPYVKACTTTTTFLAERLNERGKQVFVVRNKVSKDDVAYAEKTLQEARRDSGFVRLCYLSGTASHNKDFATITDALLVLFEKYPELRLVLAGPLHTGDKLTPFRDRIEKVPFLSREKYFTLVAQMDINLAPLEIGNPFCESKSELKWFEAGLLSVPTVAAGTKTFKEAIIDGVDGYVATTSEEWIVKLSRLIEDSGFRKQMGERAREKVLERYTTHTGKSEEYYNYLRSKIV